MTIGTVKRNLILRVIIEGGTVGRPFCIFYNNLYFWKKCACNGSETMQTTEIQPQKLKKVDLNLFL